MSPSVWSELSSFWAGCSGTEEEKEVSNQPRGRAGQAREPSAKSPQGLSLEACYLAHALSLPSAQRLLLSRVPGNSSDDLECFLCG